MTKTLSRLLDANINRALEGLRVCEDIIRFALNDKDTTKRFKDLRHEFFDCMGNGSFDYLQIIKQRDAVKDVGKGSTDGELSRKGIEGIFFANSLRVKESFRVAEEVLKIVDVEKTGIVKSLRFKLYTLEKDAAKKLETLRHRR